MTAARRACGRCVQRYARAVDERDIDALAALFHPDAQISGARGAQSLEEWLETMRAPRSFPIQHARHRRPAHRRRRIGRATVDTYAVVYQLGDPAAGQGDLTLGIRYRRRGGPRTGAVGVRVAAPRRMVWMR